MGPAGSIASYNEDGYPVAPYRIGLIFIPLPYVILASVYYGQDYMRSLLVKYVSTDFNNVAPDGIPASVMFVLAGAYVGTILLSYFFVDIYRPWRQRRKNRRLQLRRSRVWQVREPSRFEKWWNARREQAHARKVISQRIAEQGRIAAMVCDGTGKPVQPMPSAGQSIPSSAQIVRVVNNWKVKLCRPYSA